MLSYASKNEKPRIFYGWFVLGGAFLVLTIAYSMRFSFSLFYAEILNEFGWSRAETAAAFSINLLAYGVSSPVVGTLIDRFGPKLVLVFGASLLAVGLLAMSQMNNIWLFYFLFGVVVAIGINSLGLATHNAYLPNWFVRKRGLAFGILMAGAGMANVLVSFYQLLISSLGWRGAYAVLTLLPLVTIVPLAIFVIRRTPQEKGQLPDGATDNLINEGSSAIRGNNPLVVDKEWTTTEWTLTRAMKTSRLWFMFLGQLFIGWSLNLVLGHQPIHTRDLGFTATFAASIFGIAGFSMMVGQLLSFISDRIGREVTYTLGTIIYIIGVSALTVATLAHPWLLYLYAILGGALGLASPANFAALADLFAGKHFGAINGFCILGFGIGGAIGPWLGGYIFDITGNYTIPFVMAMVAVGLSCVCLWLAAPRRVRLVMGKAPEAITGYSR